MQYYSLNLPYSLCGWKGLPYVLRANNTCRAIHKEEFDALLLCDGNTDLELIKRNDKMNDALYSFTEEGIIHFSKEPHPILPDQYYYYYDNRYVREVFWSITGKCNFRCRHCYLDAPDAAMGELSTEECISIIDQMTECGVFSVCLTGGEPFVRKDFWDLIDYIHKKKIVVKQVYTNGWLLTQNVLDEFAKREIWPEFSISFDGIGWHDWMRGVKGAEEAALRALRLCHENGFSTNTEMCIHKGNKDTIRESILALSKTGTRIVKCSDVMNTPLWLDNAEGNEITKEEYVDAVLAYIPRFYEDGMPIDFCIGSVVNLYKNSTDYVVTAEFDSGKDESSALKRHICGAARNSCYIAPDGRLLPCMPITAVPDQNVFPKVQDIGLKQALKESIYMEFVDRRVKDLLKECKTCRECQYHLKCGGGCRACAVAEGEKNLMGPGPYRCLMWKGGYLQKVHDVCDRAIAEYCSV